MSDISVASILASIEQMQQKSAATQQSIAEIQQADSALYQKQIENILSAGNVATIIQGEDNAAEMALGQRRLDAVNATGGNYADPNSQAAQQAARARDLYEAVAFQTQEIARVKTANFWDNPLESILRRPAIVNEEIALQAAKEELALTEKRINSINSQTDQGLKVANALGTQLTQEKAAARLELQMLKASDAMNQLEAGRNKQLLDAAKTLAAYDITNLGYEAQKYKILAEKEDFELRAKERADRAEENKRQFNDKLEQRRSQQDEKTKKAEEEQLVLEYYNLGAQELGLAPVKSILELKATNRADKETIIARGQKAAANLAASPEVDRGEGKIGKATPAVFADTVGDAFTTIASVEGSSLGPTATKLNKFVVDLGRRTFNEISQSGEKATKTNIPFKINEIMRGTPEVVDAKGRITSKAKSSLQTDLIKNPEEDVRQYDNPYKAPSPAAIAAAMPKIGGAPWYKEVIGNAMLAGGNEPKANHVIYSGVEALETQKLTPEQASVAISSYYKAAIVFNNMNNQYPRVGMSSQASYPALIVMPITGKEVVDMTNPVAVQNAMLKLNTQKAVLRNKSEIETGNLGWN